jgi:excinuclease ABC subunit C
MAGQSGRFVKRLERQMAEAAQAQDYERAARLRDDIGALTRATEKQAVVLADGTDADVVGVAEDQLEAAVQVFHVRGGRVRGQRGFVVDKVEELTTGELVGQFLAQSYGDEPDPDVEVEVDRRTTPGAGVTLRGTDDVPREVLVPALPPDLDVLQSWLCDLRGTNVQIRVPQRGDKRALLETVERNAAQAFALHKTKRASDLTARSLALSELQDALELPDAPLRIECFDVSHVQGTNVVASMVVFEDGLARKSEYRRFAVRGYDGNDDTASMREVVRRRFSRYLDERSETGQLDVADGHVEGETVPGQRPGIDPEIRPAPPLRLPPEPRRRGRRGAAGRGGAGGPRRPRHRRRRPRRARQAPRGGLGAGSDDPVILPRTSEGLYLLQRVRDEAHRFAIAYHRQKRRKTMTASALDGIAGSARPAARRCCATSAPSSASGRDGRGGDGGARASARTAEAVLRRARHAPRRPPSGGRPALRPRHRRGGRMTAARARRPPAAAAARRRDRPVRRRPLDGGQVPRGPRLVRRRQPAAVAAATMVDLGSRSQGAVGKIAVVVDVRSRAFSSDLRTALDEIGAPASPARAVPRGGDDALVRRFESVRRPAPAAGATGRSSTGIVRERSLLRDLRGSADLVLDTSVLNVHELRGKVVAAFGDDGDADACS